jgi:RNA polymerase-binding transcription factor DksA
MSAELTPAIRDELRAQLEATRHQLSRQLGTLRTEEAEQGREDTGESRFEEVHDSGEDSADLEAIERDAGNVAVVRAQLADVNRALEKFDAGTYGACEQCGQPIPLARLQRVPAARFDAPHQAEYEARTSAGR